MGKKKDVTMSTSKNAFLAKCYQSVKLLEWISARVSVTSMRDELLHLAHQLKECMMEAEHLSWKNKAFHGQKKQLVNRYNALVVHLKKHIPEWDALLEMDGAYLP